ncbi:alpha-2-macroglobulin family protein [Gilliamella sp. Pas-s25]|uniref:alpha-2-macroglobulin family protein n=1 Tax=Gilliamella sp. Pas-s25 TaxID=2687310 RepID=UPI00135DFCA7|nr:alpha-2-macroglobulin [Gilliamella sp. Pas-s25]MWP62953.1 alpha-2-macroglobulin family protein [Gilliamella sp. Pas-s25]
MRLVKHLAVLSLLLVLAGCDNSDNKQSASAEQIITQPAAELIDNNKTAHVSDPNDESKIAQDEPAKPVFNPTPELIEKYHDKALTVIDSSEVIVDGSSTLVITFSVPLNPNLNFSNLLRLVDRQAGNVDGAWELSDNGLELRHRYLEPNRKLELTIDKMLAAINGNSLKEVYQTEIKTQDRKPMVGFASSGFLLPSKSMNGLPVTTLNVDKIDVNFFKVKPEQLSDFIADYGFINQMTSWNSKNINKFTNLVYTSRFDLNPKRNSQETVLLNLASIPQLQQEGVYLAVMSQAGSYDYSNPASLFTISNIGIAVHVYENGKLSVITHGLDNGKPLADVNLSVQCTKSIRDSNKNCTTISAKTDATGYAEVALPRGMDYGLLTANDGKQISLLNLDRSALDLSEYNLTGSAFYQKQLFAFGPRDLYRPEETVYFNALLRNADGKPLPVQPIVVDVMSPDNQIVETFTIDAQTDSNGLYQWQYVIPANAATGKWAFRFNLGDDNYRYAWFRVEEFLPERMAMEITSASNKPIMLDKSINFDVKGWYLYGAPAAGNSLEGHVYVKNIDSIPELADYKIGDVTHSNLAHQLDNIETTLDKNGIAKVEVDTNNWGKLGSPIKLILQASLLDSGGRPVTRYASQTIWPNLQMPAVRALFSQSPYYDWSSDRYETSPTVDKGTNAEFEVAYVNIDGEKLAANHLKARIIRERRNYYWSWSDDAGWHQQYNSSEFVAQEQPLSIDASGTTKVSYQTDDYGFYRIEIIDTKNNIISSLRFRSGYNWEDNTNGTNAVRPDQVKLSLDKTAYSVGDTAKIHVQAPVAGSGYVSLETNGGMLWKQDITVDENGLDVEIPIQDWGRHDIYINAMIIRPSTDATVQTVKRAIGLLYLPIDTSNRQLNVSIEAPKKTEPERTIPIKVKMDKNKIHQNHQVTVLVSAVDSGVLNITNFATPDPYSAFLGRKRYNVDLYDVYGKLIEGKGRNVNMSFGGDAMLGAAGAGGKKTLTEVHVVAQQLQTIDLNDEGEGVVDLVLPNFNGELRIMAQAWDDSRYGKAEQAMIVASPVVAELSTPRFLSGGDQAILALDLNNLTEKTQTMQVDVSTDGLIHQNAVKSVTATLDSKQRRIIQLPIVADYGYGKGIVTINVKGILLDDGSNYQIKRSWKVGVRPAYAATTKYYAAAINGGESWQLPKDSIAEMIENTVDGKLIISDQPPLNIAQYIKELFAYPYGCLEQTISGLMPSLYVNQQQLAALGIKTESDEQRREKVQLGISRILSMQRNNGSFGLWNNESAEEHWLTVYATDFLLQAKERGYNINNDALNAAISRISQYIYDANAFNSLHSYYENSQVSDYTQFATKAYALAVLAKQNKITVPMRNEINRMAQQITESNFKVLSPLPVAQLALSAKLAGFDNVYNSLMPQVFTTSYDNQYAWLGEYGSAIRDNALVLSLLIENGLSVDKQADYLIHLSDLLNDTRYFSTQELNALFVAGWSLDQHKSSHKFNVVINEQSNQVDSTLSRSFGFVNLASGLTISNPQDAQPLYIKFTVSGYGKNAPAPTSDENVLTIKRTYYDLKGNKIQPDQMKVGDLMAVVLDVNSHKEAIHDALIVDFLPAGLELENQNLTNSSVSLQAIPELANLLKDEDSNDVKYQEFRDDRYVAAVDMNHYVSEDTYRTRVAYLVRAVTAGNYMIPYPYVESMYRPDRFAIGQSTEVMSIVERNLEPNKPKQQ